MVSQSTAAIVGAGVGGLAAAVRLAAAGLRVVVFEQNAYVGGKLTAFEQGGYRFDAGPSLFTLPGLVDDVFIAAGRDPRAYFRYESKDVACRYFWEDGRALTAYTDLDRFAAEVEDQFAEGDALRAYLARAAELFEGTQDFFLNSSLHRLQTFTQPGGMRALATLPKLGLLTTLDARNRKSFRAPHLVQLFNRYATYNGSSPFQTPGVMQMIPHLEHGLGTYLPKGGMHAIAKSLHTLGKELGVEYRLGAKVSEIHVEDGSVTGLSVRGENGEECFDQILINADVQFAYRHLLPRDGSIRRPERTLRQEPSSSALIFYWGIDRSFPELDLHNIFFTEDYRREFEGIFGDADISDDPTIYVNITSKMEPGDAPAGSENWFVMINMPSDRGQDWTAVGDHVRLATLDKLRRMMGVDLERHIQVERRMGPREIESRTSSTGGALYGTSSNSRMAAFLRHPNRHSNVRNLYFCGGSAHPGGGIPLCLWSAKIASEWMLED